MSATRHEHNGAPAVKHEETRSLDNDGNVLSSCLCGGHWSHPPRRPPEMMDAIFRSHVAYFTRAAAGVF